MMSPSRRSVPFEEAVEMQANYYVSYGRNKCEENKNFTVTHYLDLAYSRGGAPIKY